LTFNNCYLRNSPVAFIIRNAFELTCTQYYKQVALSDKRKAWPWPSERGDLAPLEFDNFSKKRLFS